MRSWLLSVVAALSFALTALAGAQTDVPILKGGNVLITGTFNLPVLALTGQTYCSMTLSGGGTATVTPYVSYDGGSTFQTFAAIGAQTVHGTYESVLKVTTTNFYVAVTGVTGTVGAYEVCAGTKANAVSQLTPITVIPTGVQSVLVVNSPGQSIPIACATTYPCGLPTPNPGFTGNQNVTIVAPTDASGNVKVTTPAPNATVFVANAPTVVPSCPALSYPCGLPTPIPFPTLAVTVQNATTAPFATWVPVAIASSIALTVNTPAPSFTGNQTVTITAPTDAAGNVKVTTPAPAFTGNQTVTITAPTDASGNVKVTTPAPAFTGNQTVTITAPTDASGNVKVTTPAPVGTVFVSNTAVPYPSPFATATTLGSAGTATITLSGQSACYVNPSAVSGTVQVQANGLGGPVLSVFDYTTNQLISNLTTDPVAFNANGLNSFAIHAGIAGSTTFALSCGGGTAPGPVVFPSAQPVTVANPTAFPTPIGWTTASPEPVQFAGQQIASGALPPCGASIPVSFSGTTAVSGASTIQLFNVSGSTKYYICGFQYYMASSVQGAILLITGTKTTSNCDTGVATVMSIYMPLTTGEVVIGPYPYSIAVSAASKQLCIQTTGTSTFFEGIVWVTQQA